MLLSSGYLFVAAPSIWIVNLVSGWHVVSLRMSSCELWLDQKMVSKHEKNSWAWKTFDIEVGDGRKRAVCNLCKVSLAYSSGTGNLLSHIDTKHPELSSAKSESSGKQLTLATGRKCSAQRSGEITKAIAQLIAIDLRPIATVDGTGFNKLMYLLEPEYRVLSRPHITSTCRKLYNNLKEQLFGELQLSYISFTTDS